MDELTALNVWVAEHIWNWKLEDFPPNGKHDWGVWWINDASEPQVTRFAYQPAMKLPQAWEVLQECQRHHVYLQVEAAMPQGYYGDARIHATGDEQGFSASTAPELICYMAQWAYEKLGADGWRDSFNPVYKAM